MARAEGYGGTLYQRVLVAVVASLLLGALGAGPAAAAEQSTDFRIPNVDHARGVDHLSVVSPPALGQDPAPADRLRVVDLDGRPLDARVQRAAAPLEVVVVADASGGPASVEAIQGALKEFVLSLPPTASVAVVAAGQQPHLLASLTRSPAAALAGIALLGPTTPGLPEAAIDLGLDQLTGTPGTHPVVVEVRMGSYRSSTAATQALEPTRDRLTRERVDVYAVHLGTELGEPTIPVPVRGGFLRSAHGLPDLLGALDSIALDLSLPRYSVDVFGLDRAVGVRLISDWHGVHSEGVTLAGPAGVAPPPPPLPEPPGRPLPKIAAVAGAVVLVAAILLVPPLRRRRRAARAATTPAPPAGLPLRPWTPTAPVDSSVQETGLGGSDVEGTTAVRTLLGEGARGVAEVWLAPEVEPSVRAELVALAAHRRVPVRDSRRPGAALPVAARAAPLVPTALRVLWSGDARPVVLAVAGSPSDAELGSILRAAGTSGAGGAPAVAGVVLPRGTSTRVTAAAAASAAGAIERLRFALVPDLGAALSGARASGVRVVGVVAGGTAAPVPLELDGPTLVVVSADGDLERSLRARCDAVVTLRGTAPAEQVAALVAALAPPEGPVVDLRDAVRTR